MYYQHILLQQGEVSSLPCFVELEDLSSCVYCDHVIDYKVSFHVTRELQSCKNPTRYATILATSVAKVSLEIMKN